MPSNLFYLDFETFSKVDVKKVGAYRYAYDESTEALCMAYAYNDGPIQLWLPVNEFPDIEAHLDAQGKLVAHNIEFERELLWQLFDIDTAISDWIDTAAMARFQSLPGGLDDLCAYFSEGKDKEGHRAMLKLCKPRKPSKNNPATRWTPESAPDDFEALYRYCKWDVEIMRRNFQRLRPMSASERRIWILTIEMNERGLPIDIQYLAPIKQVLKSHADVVQAKVVKLTGGIKTTQTLKLTEWLGLPNLQKATVIDALSDSGKGLPPGKERQVLQYRFDINKASLKKIPAIENFLCADNCVRGSMVYAGADRTRRWSGAGIQPQNFPRGIKGEKLDSVFSKLRTVKNFAHVSGATDLFVNPHNELSEALKGLIIPANGHPWIIADYSQIEARVLAWYAGEEDLIHLFETGQDPYIALASVIYNIPKESIAKDSEARFLGKTVLLGSGYNLGGMGLHGQLQSKFNKFVPLEECKRLISVYRSENPGVVKFWATVERAFKAAIRGRTVSYKGLTFAPDGGESISITLPSSGVLYYNSTELDEDGRIRYFGRNQHTHKLEQVQTYGGKITENIVQATSRDIMAEAMLRIDAAGYPIVLTVHDEIMAELTGSEKQFVGLMTQRPEWGQDIPLAVEYIVADRYQKG